MRVVAAPIEVDLKFVHSLDVNGMSGRYIRLPSKNNMNKRPIIVIGGFLSSAEKHFGLLDHLRSYGSVHYIDLPGYGGMDSLFKIDEHPFCDNYGDYIYSVLKTLKLNNRATMICLGSSVNFVSNLLNRHPACSVWFKKVIHIDGIDNDVNEVSFGEVLNKGASLLKMASSKPTINRVLYRRLLGRPDEKLLSPDEQKLIDHLFSSNDIRSHITVMRDIRSNPNFSIMPTKVVSISLKNPYKNFKLYDSEEISSLLPHRLAVLLNS